MSILKLIMEAIPSILESTSIKEEIPLEVRNTLIKKYPEIPSDKLTEIVESFLELLREESHRIASSPQESQEKKIQGFVANIISKHFNLSESIAMNLSFYLLNKGDMEKQKELSKCRFSSDEIERVNKSLLGIDVVYERLSGSKWEYTTRIFMTSADKTLKYENSGELSPDSLPKNIRSAFMNEGKEKQTFILYKPQEK